MRVALFMFRKALRSSFMSWMSFQVSWVSNLSSLADRILMPAFALMMLETVNIFTLMSSVPGLWRASRPLAVMQPASPMEVMS